MSGTGALNDGIPSTVPEGSVFSGLSLPEVIPGLNENPPPVGETFSDFANGILKGIPEQDRAIVAKYIKDWDGNVTKKFQSIHEEYKPYKDLGAPEEIAEALQYIQLLNDDPVTFVQKAIEALTEEGMWNVSDSNTNVNGNEGTGSSLPEYEGLPPAFVQEFQSMKSMLEEFGKTASEVKQTVAQKEQLEQVDNLMKTLHNTHGDFEEEYVLMKLSQGAKPEEAIKAWQDTLSKYSSPPRKPAPTIINGAGSVPAGQVDLSKLDKSQRTALMVSALNNANG
jgi:hypothetical protein